MFRDTNYFLLDKLDNLASNLYDNEKIFTNQCFVENAKLMSRKGVYPYDYMKCNECLMKHAYHLKKSFVRKVL